MKVASFSGSGSLPTSGSSGPFGSAMEQFGSFAGSSANASISSYVSLDPEQLNDRQLFERCRHFGGLALKARRHFIGLLPLVEKRRLYERHGGFYSVYDFAAMMGGVGRDIVNEVLHLEYMLRDAPKLRKKLHSGEIGWAKIRVVAGLVTHENENTWIQKLEMLSKNALMLYLRDYRRQVIEEKPNIVTAIECNQGSSGQVAPLDYGQSRNQSIETFENGVKNKAEFRPGSENATEKYNRDMSRYEESKLNHLTNFRETLTFSVRSDLAAKLRLFRQQLERTRKEMITWEEVMDEFLKLVEQARVEQKTCQADQAETSSSIVKPATRHIPNATKREVLQRFNGLCAFRDCTKPAEILHHTRRFSLSMKKASEAGTETDNTQNPTGASTSTPTVAEVHDPRYIQPLCKAHERIIHATLVANEEIDPSIWKLLAAPDMISERYTIDRSVNSFRKPK